MDALTSSLIGQSFEDEANCNKHFKMPTSLVRHLWFFSAYVRCTIVFTATVLNFLPSSLSSDANIINVANTFLPTSFVLFSGSQERLKNADAVCSRQTIVAAWCDAMDVSVFNRCEWLAIGIRCCSKHDSVCIVLANVSIHETGGDKCNKPP